MYCLKLDSVYIELYRNLRESFPHSLGLRLPPTPRGDFPLLSLHSKNGYFIVSSSYHSTIPSFHHFITIEFNSPTITV